MRSLALFGLVLASCLASSQAQPLPGQQPAQGPHQGQKREGAPNPQARPKPPTPQELVAAMPPPQASVVLKEHRLGPEMVTITMLDPKYPEAILGEISRRMGKNGQAIRGLQVVKTQVGPGPDDVFLKATFAADDYINRETGKLDVVSVARAFAGVPEPHQITAIMVTFDGEQPSPKTLRSYSGPSLALAASASQAPLGIEYRIQLKTQDPTKITAPDEQPAPGAQAPATSPVGPALPLPSLLLILAGAAALGVLVYLLASQGTKARSPRPR